jgi:RNA polymerase sigma-70 factor (ECF subfamily)
MASQPDSRTSPSLLVYLRHHPSDQEAWGRFVQRYGRKIYGWARRWGLQEADAEDVTQNVLAKLVVQLATFAYDPSQSFRGWLKTLTHHAWYDFLQARRPDTGSGDSAVLESLHSIAARADLVQHLEQAYDEELLQAAMTRVQLRVAPRTWEAFRLTALEGLSGAEAAQRLEMQVAAVYMAKRNVQKKLREESRLLEGAGTG